MKHNKESLFVLEHKDFWATEVRKRRKIQILSLSTPRSLGVVFTTTCRYQVISRPHSCLKHSVCSAGQVSLQTHGMKCGADVFLRVASPDFHVSVKDVVLLETL